MNVPFKTVARSLGIAMLCGTIFLLTGSTPNAVAASAASEMRVLVVTGQGEAKAKPDQAQLSAGVVTQAATAADALAANSRAMTRVFSTIKALGIPDNKIQTSNFSVQPQYPPYNQTNPQPHRIIGYEVSNQVTIIVDDLDKLGPALDALVKSGSNQLNGVNFTIANPKPLEEKARRAAIAEAITKAKDMAEAAGVRLGPILSIQEGYASAPVPMPMMMRTEMMAAPAPPPPMAAGEQSTSATVTITYAIE